MKADMASLNISKNFTAGRLIVLIDGKLSKQEESDPSWWWEQKTLNPNCWEQKKSNPSCWEQKTSNPSCWEQKTLNRAVIKLSKLNKYGVSQDWNVFKRSSKESLSTSRSPSLSIFKTGLDGDPGMVNWMCPKVNRCPFRSRRPNTQILKKRNEIVKRKTARVCLCQQERK